MLDERQITALVQRFYSSALDDENHLRLSTGVQFDDEFRQAAVEWFDWLGSRIRDALAGNALHHADDWVDAILEREGIHELDSLSRARLQQAALRAGQEVVAAKRKRFEGDFNHQPTDPLLSQPVADLTPISVAVAPNVQDSTVPDSPLFSTRADEYRQKRLRLKTWDSQTALQARTTYRLFAEVCGDRPLGGYVRSDAVRFKDILVKLPAMYGKATRYRNMKVVDIASASRDGSEPRLARRTIERHLSALACLWDDAIEAGEVSATIFGNFKLPAAKRSRDQRDMWSSEQLRHLFDTPVWRGCYSDARRTRPGDVIVRDEKFWIPLIALLSGMRQEEICQLHVEDIRQERDIWIFDVNDRPPRQLKNRNACRLVPIHHELIRLGLLDYVRHVRQSGTDRLFPGLQPGGADKRFGHNFAKWFTRYRQDTGLYREFPDFHSFRHSATTFLAHADVDPVLIDALTGHETTGETARYTRSFRIEQLKAAIDRLDPEIDLSYLYPHEDQA